LFNFGDDIKAH